MWIASQLGFFSIVQKEGFFHVRARLRSDLEALRATARVRVRIEEWPAADYRYRLRVNAAALARIFRALEKSVDYPNFKSRIAQLPAQQEKLAAYGRLWSALYQLQQDANPPHQKYDHAGAGART
jgi:hypothetical protein